MTNSVKNILPQHQSQFNRDGARFRLGNQKKPRALARGGLHIYSDGGARGNPGPAAIGVYITDEDGDEVVKISKRIGQATNNEAEYRAVIEALKWIKTNLQFSPLRQSLAGRAIFPASPKLSGASNFQFFLDSKLVVNQLNGIFKIKESRLRNLIIEVRQLEQAVGGNIFYTYIPREKNKIADKLVNASFNS